MDKKIFREKYEGFLNANKTLGCEMTSVLRESIKNSAKLGSFKGHIKATIAMEECAELCQAISKCVRMKMKNKDAVVAGSNEWYDLLEEMADITICMEYLKQVFDITPQNYTSAVKVKLERELYRNAEESKKRM